MDALKNFSGSAHWALRIAVAAVFLYHGLTKFPALQGMSEMLGVPVFMVVIVALIETSIGILVILGAFFDAWMTRLAGLLIIPVMVGAIAMVHWPVWSFAQNGMEFQVTLILIGVYLLLKGNAINRPATT